MEHGWSDRVVRAFKIFVHDFRTREQLQTVGQLIFTQWAPKFLLWDIFNRINFQKFLEI